MTVSLTSCPMVRRRGPPPTSARRPFGEGHHRTRAWVPSGVKVRQVQDGLKIDTTCSAQRPGRVGAGRLAHPRPRARSGCIAPQIGGPVLLSYTVAGLGQRSSAVRYGSVSWHAVEGNTGGQEDLPRPSMRTIGNPVNEGRLRRWPDQPQRSGIDGGRLGCCTSCCTGWRSRLRRR